MNDLQIFRSEQFGEIRVIQKDGQPWFVGRDIAERLGYQDTDQALRTHVEEEDKLTRKIDGLGQARNMITINESGLYSLVLSSKLPQAKKFKKWVTNEVLPTIRKTGGYVNDDDLFINTYLPYVDDTTKMLFKSTLETVRKQNKKIEEQQKVIEHKEDVIIGLIDEVTLAEKRQILNRVVRYKGANFQERWRELYKQFEMKYHIDLTKRYESYNLKNKPKMKSKVDYIDKVMNKIPELYDIACKLYESDVKELAEQIYLLN